VSLFKSLLFVQ